MTYTPKEVQAKKEENKMKLNEISHIIPTHQYVRLRENGSIIAMGYIDNSLADYGDVEINSLYVSNGVLEINVRKED